MVFIPCGVVDQFSQVLQNNHSIFFSREHALPIEQFTLNILT